MRRNDTIRVATFAGPGAAPVMQTVPWPQIPNKAALIQIGACGVCGTDLHILKGHWPKPLPWPFRGLYGGTVSTSPPTARTTGTVPYRRLYIWLSPHGSYTDGIRNISAPASIRWARSFLKPL